MVRNGVGHLTLREPVGWTGRYVNPKGKRFQVESREAHLEGLDDVRLYPSIPCHGESTEG